MAKKNTPIENEASIAFLENSPDAIKLAHIIFRAIEKGECISWEDYGIEFALARTEFRRDFATELSGLLKAWL
jgi:hypothetical protein